MKIHSSSRKILSIDFASYEIKVVEGRYTKNSINILKSFKIKLPKASYRNGEILDKNLIISLLKKSIKDNKIKTSLTYGIVNSSSIITREILIPKVPDKEITSLINFQLEEFLPVDPVDYIVNNLVINEVIQDEVEKLKILLIAVPKNMIFCHLDLIRETGLKPAVLDYQGNCIAKLLKYSDFINEDYNTRDIVIASVDIGQNTKLTIVKNGKIEVSRFINIGAESLHKDLSGFFDYSLGELEKKLMNISNITKENIDYTGDSRLINLTKTTLTKIMEEIESIFRYYTSREDSNEINLILIQGGLSNISEIDNLFSNYFNISCIKLTSLQKINGNNELESYSNAIGGLIRIDEVGK